MQTRHLIHLAAIVEHGNFGAASRALGISQPALTKSIQSLERLLGAQLLERSRSGATLTAIGNHVVKRAAALVQGAAEIQREVDLLRGLEIGNLVVGVGPAMAETFVTVAIAKLAAKMPRAHIRVRVDHWVQLSEWLHEGELDLYVADVTEATGDDRIEIVRMPTERLVWFCRSKHPLASLRRVTRADLMKYPIVTPKIPRWAREWLAEAALPRSQGVSGPEFNTVECENHAMLKRMVQHTDCVSASLEATVSREVAEGSIVVLPIKAPPLTTAAGIVHSKDRMLSPIAEALVQEILNESRSTAAGKRRTGGRR